jgi:hypothetical protein
VVKASPETSLSEGCFLRSDHGRFTVFVATFVPSGTRFHHAHEDLLSWCVYLDGEELLCDPGMPSYAAADRHFAAAGSHNGLHGAGDFAPRPGLFVPAPLARARAEARREGETLAIHVQPEVGPARTLTISTLPDGVKIEERVEHAGPCSFSLCVVDAGARWHEQALSVQGARLEFSGIEAPSLSAGERARDYGERLPCARLHARATSHVITRIHHVR